MCTLIVLLLLILQDHVHLDRSLLTYMCFLETPLGLVVIAKKKRMMHLRGLLIV